jgi:hypothetical protein
MLAAHEFLRGLIFSARAFFSPMKLPCASVAQALSHAWTGYPFSLSQFIDEVNYWKSFARYPNVQAALLKDPGCIPCRSFFQVRFYAADCTAEKQIGWLRAECDENLQQRVKNFIGSEERHKLTWKAREGEEQHASAVLVPANHAAGALGPLFLDTSAGEDERLATLLTPAHLVHEDTSEADAPTWQIYYLPLTPLEQAKDYYARDALSKISERFDAVLRSVNAK